MRLFKEINVWKRNSDETLVRFRCFQNLETNGYHVRSADFFENPIGQKELDERDAYFYDFLSDYFAEGDFEEYGTLAEAIEAHEADFSET